MAIGDLTPGSDPAARSETPAAFGRRYIPCVAPSSNIPDIAPHRAHSARWGPRSAVVAPLRRGPHGADWAPGGGSSGRLAVLGATLDFHHGLPGHAPGQQTGAGDASTERRAGAG